MNSLKQDLQRAALEFGYPTLGAGDVRRIARRRNNVRRVSAGLVALAVILGPGVLWFQAFDRGDRSETSADTSASVAIEPPPTLSSANPFGSGPWEVREIDGIPQESSVRPYVLYFADQMIVGKINCTEFEAPFEVNGSSLIVGELVADLGGCGPAETSYLRHLASLEAFELGEHLLLRSPSGSLLLLPVREETGP